MGEEADAHFHNSGEKWRKQRRAMEPAFQYKKIKTLVPLFAQCANKLLQKWELIDNKPICVELDIAKMTLDAIGKCFRH